MNRNKLIIICEDCKKDFDNVIVNMFVGDSKKIKPIKRIYKEKCARCGRAFVDNQKKFAIRKKK